MHRQLASALASLMLLTLVACGGDDDASAGPAPTVTASTLLSDGLWRRVVTTADAEAVGIGPADVAAVLGADGQAVLELEIDGDRWKQYVTEDDGRRALGDLGTWSLDDDGNWVTVSDSPGCRGCTGVIRVTGTPERMTTAFQSAADDPVARVMVEGTWERQS
jgi:hypothetical protein